MISTEQDRTIAEGLRRDFAQAGYPDTQYVSAAVYEAVERVILDWVEQMDKDYPLETHTVVVGRHGGLMFKNVELLLVR